MNTMTLKLAGAAILASLAVAETPAATIYQDDFNRIGDLNGSTPTVTTGGNVWISNAYSTNGTQAITTETGWMAILPFAPVQGNVYTLTATLEALPSVVSLKWLAI